MPKISGMQQHAHGPFASEGRRDLLVFLLLGIATLAIYAKIATYGFVNFDDPAYVTSVPLVTAGLNGNTVLLAFSNLQYGHYFPLTWILYASVCHFFGLNPHVYHLLSILLHTLNVFLLYRLLAMMTGARWQSALVAMLFAVHPLNVEAVAWITELSTLWSTFWGLCTLWAYYRYVQNQSPGRYFLVFALFILALLAKPVIFTFPFVLLLLDYWPLKRFSTEKRCAGSCRRIVLEKIPFLVPVLLDGALCIITQYHYGSIPTMANLSATARLGNAIISYVSYLIKMVWPANLACFYAHRVMIPLWSTGASLAVLLLISAVAAAKVRRYPYLLVGWLWYLGTLFPMIGLLQTGSQAMADRYAYISFIGLFLAAVWGVADIWKRWTLPQWILAAASVLTVLGLGTVSFIQTGYWKNSFTLFEHALKVAHPSPQTHAGFAAALQEQNRLDEAQEQYREAIRLCTPDSNGYDDLCNNLGSVLKKLGKIDGALDCYRQALQANPRCAKTRFNMAQLYLEQGNVRDASLCYQQAIRMGLSWDFDNDYGAFLARHGRLDEAISKYRLAIQKNPLNDKAHNNLGLSLVKQGKEQEAVSFFSRAVQINPANAEAHFNLAVSLLALGNSETAVHHLSIALEIRPDYREAQEALALVKEKLAK